MELAVRAIIFFGVTFQALLIPEPVALKFAGAVYGNRITVIDQVSSEFLFANHLSDQLKMDVLDLICVNIGQ